MSLPRARVISGVGIVGDRYALRAGYWRDERVSRDLTLVEGEVVDDLAHNGLVLAPGELRRNLTTRGVVLNDLLGRVFWIGDVLLRGTELCEPCRHLEEITGKRLLRPLVHRRGLRAQVLLDGVIGVGDSLEPAEELAGVGVVVRREDKVLLGRRLSVHGYGCWSFPGGKPQDRGKVRLSPPGSARRLVDFVDRLERDVLHIRPAARRIWCEVDPPLLPHTRQPIPRGGNVTVEIVTNVLVGDAAVPLEMANQLRVVGVDRVDSVRESGAQISAGGGREPVGGEHVSRRVLGWFEHARVVQTDEYALGRLLVAL